MTREQGPVGGGAQVDAAGPVPPPGAVADVDAFGPHLPDDVAQAAADEVDRVLQVDQQRPPRPDDDFRHERVPAGGEQRAHLPGEHDFPTPSPAMSMTRSARSSTPGMTHECGGDGSLTKSRRGRGRGWGRRRRSARRRPGRGAATARTRCRASRPGPAATSQCGPARCRSRGPGGAAWPPARGARSGRPCPGCGPPR
jgi:hypothetical protein